MDEPPMLGFMGLLSAMGGIGSGMPALAVPLALVEGVMTTAATAVLPTSLQEKEDGCSSPIKDHIMPTLVSYYYAFKISRG
jgi:hypothetical protein